MSAFKDIGCRVNFEGRLLSHWSSCAVHNEPAFPAGDCDCGGYEPGMMGISHWGMFETAPPLVVIPAGWKVKDLDTFIAESHRPCGFIEIVRDRNA